MLFRRTSGFKELKGADRQSLRISYVDVNEDKVHREPCFLLKQYSINGYYKQAMLSQLLFLSAL
jgi:hypothetical protein